MRRETRPDSLRVIAWALVLLLLANAAYAVWYNVSRLSDPGREWDDTPASDRTAR
jgi:hypothetical protein